MHAFVQKGLLGVLIAGGITLCGATAANAATIDGPGDNGSQQSNGVVNLGSGNAVGGIAVSPVTTVNGNSVNLGGSGGSSNTQSNTVINNGADSSATSASPVSQSNGGNTGGGSQPGSSNDQSNGVANVGSGNAVGGIAVSPVTTVNGNSVNVGQGGSNDPRPPAKQDDKPGQPAGGSSSTASNTVINNGADSSAVAVSPIDQKNTSTGDQPKPAPVKDGKKDGDKPKGDQPGGGQPGDQSNEVVNIGSGNAIGGIALSPVTTVNGNSINVGQGPSKGGSSSTGSNTVINNGADSSAVAYSPIDQKNTSKGDQPKPAPVKDGKKDGDKPKGGQPGGGQPGDQSNKVVNILSGNAIGGISSSPVTTINGNSLNLGQGGTTNPRPPMNTVPQGPSNGGSSSTGSNTVINNGADSSAVAYSPIDQKNTSKGDQPKPAPVKDGNKPKGDQPRGGQPGDQSNKVVNILSGNAIGGISFSPVTTINGNSLNLGGSGGSSSTGSNTVITNGADSSAVAYSPIEQKNGTKSGSPIRY